MTDKLLSVCFYSCGNPYGSDALDNVFTSTNQNITVIGGQLVQVTVVISFS